MRWVIGCRNCGAFVSWLSGSPLIPNGDVSSTFPAPFSAMERREFSLPENA